MSAREWKPGDVALWADEQVGIRVSSCPNDRHEPGEHWHLAAGGWISRNTVALRPLVVIDPEDREQVERLVAACRREFGWTSGPVDGDTDATQLALRSLVADPKAEEPTGVGAVALGSNGKQYVLVDPDVGAGWVERESGVWHTWETIPDPEVQTEGVTA